METAAVLAHEHAATARRLKRLAWLLDSSIPLPGLDFRIGLDALIGLAPGIGDIIGTVLSSYIVAEAARIGAPRALLLQMAANVAVEGIVGMVPLLGDVFDAGWKANQRNVGLLSAYLEQPAKARRASTAFVLVLIVILSGVLIGCGALTYLAVRWLLTAA